MSNDNNKTKKEFKRQNAHKHDRVDESWRKPRGKHSPMRQKRKHAPKMPNVGFRAPKDARGLHPSGLDEVLVHNTDDLEKLDAAEHAVRIGSSVGGRKREQIAEKAEEQGLHLLNYSESQEEPDDTEDIDDTDADTDEAADETDVQNTDDGEA